MEFNRIKLVATDMDGTLLDSKKRLPDDFIPWVSQHPDIKTIIASGRQFYALKRDFGKIEDSLIFISENGSLVFEKGKIIYQDLMKTQDVFSCLKRMESIPFATPILCGVSSAYMKKTKEDELLSATMYYERLKQVDNLYSVAENEKIVKLAIYFKEKRAEQSYSLFLSLNPNLKSVVSGVSWIDIANKDANKGAALQAIMDRYHILKEESMAFGDYFNDVEMLEKVKYSFAMANAHPDVKKAARYLTSTNDEEGVMKVLRQIV